MLSNEICIFGDDARDVNFVRVLTVSLLLRFWGLQLIELDTFLFPCNCQRLAEKIFNMNVKSEYVIYPNSSAFYPS